MIKSGENVVFNNPPDIYQCRFILIVTDLSSQNQKWHSELGLFPLFFFFDILVLIEEALTHWQREWNQRKLKWFNLPAAWLVFFSKNL